MSMPSSLVAAERPGVVSQGAQPYLGEDAVEAIFVVSSLIHHRSGNRRHAACHGARRWCGGAGAVSGGSEGGGWPWGRRNGLRGRLIGDGWCRRRAAEERMRLAEEDVHVVQGRRTAGMHALRRRVGQHAGCDQHRRRHRRAQRTIRQPPPPIAAALAFQPFLIPITQALCPCLPQPSSREAGACSAPSENRVRS